MVSENKQELCFHESRFEKTNIDKNFTQIKAKLQLSNIQQKERICAMRAYNKGARFRVCRNLRYEEMRIYYTKSGRMILPGRGTVQSLEK